MSQWSPLVLFVLLATCKVGVGEEKYPPILQKLREKYEPLRAQHESQRLAIQKVESEILKFNTHFAVPKDPFSTTVREKGSPSAPGTNEVDKGDVVPKPINDTSLFDLSEKRFSTEGMGMQNGYGPTPAHASKQALDDLRLNASQQLERIQGSQRNLYARKTAETLALTRDDAELIVEYFSGLQRDSGFMEFATCVVAETVLRETGNQSLRSTLLATPITPKIGLLLMDLYHDERSLKLLLKMLHTQPQALPSGLLLGYDLNEEFRTQIRGELAKEAAERLLTERKKALSGLLSSLEYADSLEPNAKRRYQDFERRFYAAESISPPDRSRSLLNYINYGAYFFRWKEGDSTFLAHKLECSEAFFFDHALARKLEAYYAPEKSIKVKEAEEKKK